MASTFGTWWQKIRAGLGWLWQRIQHHPFIATGCIVVLIVFVFLVLLFGWDWTGFSGGYSTVTTHRVIHGVSTDTQQPPAKTLWDLLQLLIVPIILAIGGFWLNQIQKSRDEKATEQRDQTEREIAADNQREAALQAYIDKMSELLLEKKLRESAEGDEIQKIARVRTLTVLRGLDTTRKASVLQFLLESGLLDKNKPIIHLNGADLSGKYIQHLKFAKKLGNMFYEEGALS
jgi:hypothetical protein